MHIVGWERDRTIGGRPASISRPSSSSSLTVFESALWLRVRVSQPRPGGAPARQRRAPSSSFNYASAGGGIRGGTGSRHVAVGFRRRRWEPALLRGHSVFPPLSCWLSDCGDGLEAVFRRPGETSGAWEEGEAVWVDGTGRMSCRGGQVDAGAWNWKGRRRGRGK